MTQTTENSLDVQSQLPVISFDYSVPQSEHKSACVSESAKNDTQAAPAQTITMSIVMEYAPEKDATVKALLDALEKHCISFATRVR